MNKLILALGLTLASSVALAQTEDAPTASAKVPHGRMQDALGLTDEQVKEMRAIRDAGGSREEMNAVLTPEQQLKAVDHRKARQANPEKRMDRMKQKLDLSDEQVAQIQEIKQAGGSREEVRAVLTSDQQAEFDEMRKNHQGKGPKTEE
jgi:hypothetical protein